MAADGGEPTAVTTSPRGRFEYSPAFSPDGSKIAFVSRHGPNDHGSDEPQKFQIVVVNADGTERTTVTEFTFEGYPCDTYLAWSPRGKGIAFNKCAVDPDGGVHVYVLDFDTRISTPITRGQVFDGSPSWVR